MSHARLSSLQHAAACAVFMLVRSATTCAECAIVDGGAYFDEATTTWHYLGQCLARDDVWNMCHYTLQGEDPMAGNFNVNPHNPVVRSGQLWSSICAGQVSATCSLLQCTADT
jgi:hypothetical protein